MNHSSAVGMAARALYMLKDEKKIIDAHTIIECNYGNVNKKMPGHIIMQNAAKNMDDCVCTINGSEVQWNYEKLVGAGVGKEHIDDVTKSLSSSK